MYFCEILGGVLLLLIQQFKGAITLALLVWGVLFSAVLAGVIANWTNDPVATPGGSIGQLVGQWLFKNNGHYAGI
jgi:hypothetical protein